MEKFLSSFEGFVRNINIKIETICEFGGKFSDIFLIASLFLGNWDKGQQFFPAPSLSGKLSLLMFLHYTNFAVNPNLGG